MGALQLICVFVALASLCASAPLPHYYDSYYMEGFIEVPYANIKEPFLLFFDGPNKRMRVDYYNGVYTSITTGAGGVGYRYGSTKELVYYTDKTVLNELRCYESRGMPWRSINITNFLPDLTGFKFVGQEKISDDLPVANVYQLNYTAGPKTNTYTFYTDPSTNQPLKYDMMGYDAMLGSHYDKYTVTYLRYVFPYTYTAETFAIPEGMTCDKYPGPPNMHSISPIPELLHRQDQHVENAFDDFKRTHGKQYEASEHETRKNTFKQNFRYVHSMNRAGLTYSLKLNHLADLTQEEISAMTHGLVMSQDDFGGAKFNKSEFLRDVPDAWDWYSKGGVTKVKDQGLCHSPWSFSVTGAIEGANFMTNGKLVTLSEQELIDCAWGSRNSGCARGERFAAYRYILANGGISSADQYGKFLGVDGKCHKDQVNNVVTMKDFTVTPYGDIEFLKKAVYLKGPSSVGVDASHKSFVFYAKGIYSDPDCKKNPASLGHALVVVGYGNHNGDLFWIMKNSWSSYWGIDGFMFMLAKDNHCGVATGASFVEIKKQ